MVLNRYVEQLVASAEAAVEEVIRRGVSCVKFLIDVLVLFRMFFFSKFFLQVEAILFTFASLGCTSK